MTTAIETIGDLSDKEMREADNNFDEFINQLRSELKQLRNRDDDLFQDDIKRISNIVESDKVVSLTDSGNFIIEIPIVDEKNFRQIAEYDWNKGYSIVSVKLNIEDMTQKIHIEVTE